MQRKLVITSIILISSCIIAALFQCSNIFQSQSGKRQLREESPNELNEGDFMQNRRKLTEDGLSQLNKGNNIGFLYSTLDGNKDRPHIHTFFNYIDDPKVKGDNNLLELWKRAWYEAGWYPVVLTLEDAQRHPMFRDYENAFDSAKNPLNVYNRMCFYRWLAMVTAGGG